MQTLQTVNEVNFHIRWMIRRDMAEVNEISKTFNEADILGLLRKRNCIGMVAEKNDKVTGYMIYELHKSKLEILDMDGVDIYWKDVMRQMIEKLKSKLSSHRRTKIEYVVPLKNLELIKLFKREKFKGIEVWRDYFEDLDDDGVLMRYSLPKTA